MSRWLAQQVGPEGCVVAADIDVRFLVDVHVPNLEVRELDLRSQAPEPRRYDLAYCRTLLLHLPDPVDALRKLRTSLTPGGWLIAQEPDAGAVAAADPDHPDAPLFGEFHRRAYAYLRRTGRFDVLFGRRLPELFESLELEQVGSRVHGALARGGTPQVAFQPRTFEALAPELIDAGVVTATELERVLELYADPTFRFMTGLQVAAWGRRPAHG